MKKCQDIRDLLPLYPEGVLSDLEKQAVDDHLAGCASCRGELDYLQKAGRLVDQLPEIEEPPWFQQKIMARIREEAEEKSFAQRWFYPLRVRIPLQVVATLVVAVLAVYIYRSGDERVKDILPGSRQPVLELQLKRAPAATRDAGDQAWPAVPRKKFALPKESRQDKQTTGDMAMGSGEQKSQMPGSASDAVLPAFVDEVKGIAESRSDTNGVLQAKQNKSTQSLPQMADKAQEKTGSTLTASVKKRESYKTSTPSARPSMAASVVVAQQAAILIQVDNLNVALTDVEKILAQFNAEKVTKQDMEGRMAIRAEISGKHWKNLLSKLKSIGHVEEKDLPSDIDERIIKVVIDITEGQLMTR